ncbi:hypothetical protein FSOLCH5_001995 [Fusarium solani]|uniref:Salicylate hydroxylase n=1 Tax=Fusarium solani TaxID=169388 RepID=A0A9P9FZW2_FUSSL|nr:salicylate hydroxylase [Fusarium solani]KAH7227256.1 salicylate hydroxylase [Fusarium solani]KAJ3471918.1 hypothetical protein MRS44_002017 [Fusarium solani]
MPTAASNSPGLESGPTQEISLRIAVIGAGLVGSFTTAALSRLPGVKVFTFEKASKPHAAGAWISLSVTGLKVLTKLIPASEVSAIAYRPPDRGVYVTRHWKTGEAIIRRYSSEDLRDEHIQARTHREPLLKLILKHVPDGIIHYDRKVTGVRVESARAALTFEEDQATRERSQPTETFDLVVAADGIYSGIRRQFFPDHQVGYKGAVAYRAIFPTSRLAAIRTRLHDDSSLWTNNRGQMVFLSELGLGMYGVVIIQAEEPKRAAGLMWERSIGREGLDELRQSYAAWDPIVVEVLAVLEDIQAYPLDSGPWLEHLSRESCVAFAGDAAHPTAGAYGAGAAMGFGDGWALARALEASRLAPGGSYQYNVHKALDLYEKIRRPFLARVEQQMGLDARNARYVGEADGEEWARRYLERNPLNLWLSEHDVELEAQKVIMELAFEPNGHQ